MPIPTHYLREEGGNWERWNGGPVEQSVLDNPPHRNFKMGWRYIHGFAFGYTRWDVFNGFTPTLEIDHSDPKRPRTIWLD